MLDIRKIRENPDVFRQKLARRNGGDEKAIDLILGLDEEIRKLKQQGEALKSDRNKANKEFGAIKAKGGDITEASAKILDVVPLRRFGEASDIATMAAYLCSEEAGYVTGQVFTVDGGMAM